MNYPERIICLTEESVETIFALGEGHRIVGVSSYVKRPVEALSLPKVSLFTSSQYDKINQLEPDLILGFSDIQKDIARDLIGMGHNVYIANHRSLLQILSYIKILSGMLGVSSVGENYVNSLQQKIQTTKKRVGKMVSRPRVYFEEWDQPFISGIKWVSDLIELCGGEDIMREKAQMSLAKDRMPRAEEIIEKDPQIVFACWCGKRVKLEQIYQRPGWQQISAIQSKRVFELAPEIFLQPGPAPIVSGIDILMDYFAQFTNS